MGVRVLMQAKQTFRLSVVYELVLKLCEKIEEHTTSNLQEGPPQAENKLEIFILIPKGRIRTDCGDNLRTLHQRVLITPWVIWFDQQRLQSRALLGSVQAANASSVKLTKIENLNLIRMPRTSDFETLSEEGKSLGWRKKKNDCVKTKIENLNLIRMPRTSDFETLSEEGKSLGWRKKNDCVKREKRGKKTEELRNFDGVHSCDVKAESTGKLPSHSGSASFSDFKHVEVFLWIDFIMDIWRRMSTYDSRVRPVLNHSTPTTNCYLKNEKQQNVDLNVWVIQKWRDDFLGWNPHLYGMINTTILPYDAIWLPDTYIYNRNDELPSEITIVFSTFDASSYYGSFKHNSHSK
ncbi:hypothetical protein DICVIV_06851 [Dictyocaulus viviparus]|uniref:Neurotransmitter-gated ion-channel ligand-binding domain-containing protein n=1 Tax=Dictyocaulus viviparus TaxID=29172 RepID=A0A0D8XXK7_DICVI|nr:hypothetical protein DICVIV_06851 [Dictyocaulus viviparus]